MRIPVWRRTCTAAQVQKALCSSRVRSRYLPPPGSCAQVRPAEAWVLAGRRRVGGAEPFGGGLPVRVHRGQQRREDGDPLAGPLVHPRLAARARLAVLGDVGVADRAGGGPRSPPGRVLSCPLGQVQVEGTDHDQVVEGVEAGRGDLGELAAG
jgi:hypothetical protein